MENRGIDAANGGLTLGVAFDGEAEDLPAEKVLHVRNEEYVLVERTPLNALSRLLAYLLDKLTLFPCPTSVPNPKADLDHVLASPLSRLV